MNSFIRQLNMYGFKKVKFFLKISRLWFLGSKVAWGNIKHDWNRSNWICKWFLHKRSTRFNWTYKKKRYQTTNDTNTKSKLRSYFSGGGVHETIIFCWNSNIIQVQSSIDNDQLAKLLHELSEQQKQTHRDFDQLKEENQDLWRQVGSLKKKHDKQQDTVQRLITFMIHFIQQAQDKVPEIFYRGNFTVYFRDSHRVQR